MTIYRSADGEKTVRELYDRAVRRLDLATEDRWVDTRFGKTHLLVAGPAAAPPLVVLQGGNSLNPLTLAWYRPLARRHRLYAPDTVGQPGLSAQTRPAGSSGEHGRWLLDVLDGLGIERPGFVGTSQGGGIILQAAAAAPRRIGPTALVVPAGIVSAHVPGMVRLALPTLLYRLMPVESWLRRAISPLFTDPPDDLWLETLGAIFRHVKLETRLPPTMTAEELAPWESPVIVFAAEDDLLYTGDRLVSRARKIIPNLEEAMLLEGSRHIPPESTLREVNRRIEGMLQG